MIRRRLFLQLSEAQLTGHVRRRPLSGFADRSRCRPLNQALRFRGFGCSGSITLIKNRESKYKLSIFLVF